MTSSQRPGGIDDALLSMCPVYRNRARPSRECMESELLALAYTSDVNKPDPEQFARAQRALRLRGAAIAEGWDGTSSGLPSASAYLALCKQIVDAHLEGRASYFGVEQCKPFDEALSLAVEGRDTFLVIKFMDEEPHLRSTIDSILTQVDIDHGRIVVVGVDNMSTDRSGEIFCDMRDQNTTRIRMIYCRQPTPGGGNAARLGVDRCIATVRAMAEASEDLSILHRARIAVSDGDTIYHPALVAEAARLFDSQHDVDGIMPFLTYKLSACLRLFQGWEKRDHQELLAQTVHLSDTYLKVPFSLSSVHCLERFPRQFRKAQGPKMRLGLENGELLDIDFLGSLKSGVRFGVIVDPAGNRVLVFEDGFLIPERAPVAGYDAVLVHLDNGLVGKDEVWRWHSMIGHDLFLVWSFAAMGLQRELILPDTSDALKSFRVWTFSVGGQHQLRRPGTERVTGTDYQSGRVHQCFGARTILGSPHCPTETEIDRLAKMIRNFAKSQSVFYGNTRAGALERASGLYLHMTRIQEKVEAEVRSYGEEFYRDVVFPERLLFPLRWMIQNFIGALCTASEGQRPGVAKGSFEILFDNSTWRDIREQILTDAELDLLSSQSFESLRARSEELAEKIICQHWVALLTFYEETVRSFLDHHDIAESNSGFLFKDILNCRNSLLEERPPTDVNEVWSGGEFIVDQERGQVLDLNAARGPA